MLRDFDFIANDYSSAMPTPEFIKAQVAFIKSMPTLTEHEYAQFVRIRKHIVRNLNDPFNIETFDDETGMGIKFNLIDSDIPTAQVWDMLSTFVVCHDWETITHTHNGIVKTRHYTRGCPSHGEHAEVFGLKLYTLVKEIPDLEEY